MPPVTAELERSVCAMLPPSSKGPPSPSNSRASRSNDRSDMRENPTRSRTPMAPAARIAARTGGKGDRSASMTRAPARSQRARKRSQTRPSPGAKASTDAVVASAIRRVDHEAALRRRVGERDGGVGPAESVGLEPVQREDTPRYFLHRRRKNVHQDASC